MPANPRKPSTFTTQEARMPMDDGWLEFPVILGQGSLHDLSEADPRNPRLVGLKSVSYAGSVALTKQYPPQRPIGFHKPPQR